MSSLTSMLFKLKGQATHLAKSNAPAILTAIGVSGTLTTAYLTGKASYEAAGIIRVAEMGEPLPEDFRDRIKIRVPLVWKLYIPAATSGVVTIGCIVLSARISTRRTAAIAAAYSVTEKAFLEYKDKVAETVGENKAEKIRDGIAQDRVDASPPSQQLLVMSGPGNVLCHDPYVGRYFHSDMETLRRAQNNVNDQLLKEGYATLTEFYASLGVYCSEWASDMGWEKDRLMDLAFSAVLFEGAPVLSIEYNYIRPILESQAKHPL